MKGQVVSVEVLVASGLFLGALLFFISFGQSLFSGDESDSFENLNSDADAILEKIELYSENNSSLLRSGVFG